MQEIVINDARKEVFVGHKEIRLTPKEYMLLKLLKESDGIISRSQALWFVWGNNKNVSTRIVDQHIARLRRKIRIPVIQTAFTYGYKFVQHTQSNG